MPPGHEPSQSGALDQSAEFQNSVEYGVPGGASFDDLDAEMFSGDVNSTTLDEWDAERFNGPSGAADSQTEQQVEDMVMVQDGYTSQEIGQIASPVTSAQAQEQVNLEVASTTPEPPVIVAR